MSDDDLIRRGDAKRALILGDTFTRAQAKLDAIPALTPGVKVKPTDAQIASACMSYRHDFGLLDGLERTLVLHQARDWLHAWQKELDLAPQPASNVAGLVRDLTKMVKAAYCEGFRDGKDGGWIVGPENQPWNASDVKKPSQRWRGSHDG